MQTVAHAVVFQLVWFACVLGAARGWGWAGPAAAAVFLTGTLAISADRRAELRLIGGAALLGLIFDSVLTSAGLLTFASPSPVFGDWLAPPWIVALWASFSTLAPRSLARLGSRPWLAAGLGALAGPFTYLSAARLGAAELTAPLPAVAGAVALEYAVAMPLVLWLASGFSNPSSSPASATEESGETPSRGEEP